MWAVVAYMVYRIANRVVSIILSEKENSEGMCALFKIITGEEPVRHYDGLYSFQIKAVTEAVQKLKLNAENVKVTPPPPPGAPEEVRAKFNKTHGS